MPQEDDLPDLAVVFGELLGLVPEGHQPHLIAHLERLAADRYRAWARQRTAPADVAGLLACAGREEEIADRVEALHPGAAPVLRAILAEHPELPELNRALFAPLPLHLQLTLQARGERLGAATWRRLAAATDDKRVRSGLLDCARLEEENADFLESIVDQVPR